MINLPAAVGACLLQERVGVLLDVGERAHLGGAERVGNARRGPDACVEAASMECLRRFDVF